MVEQDDPIQEDQSGELDQPELREGNAESAPEDNEEQRGTFRKRFTSIKKILPQKRDGVAREKGEDAKSQWTSSSTSVSGFIEHLVAKQIISRRMVDNAVAWKNTRKETEKRRLLNLLIEEFGADREKVFAEFARYYSFKTVDLSSLQIDADRLAFIRKALEMLPGQMKELAEKNKILPFETNQSDPSKLHLVTPDPTNTSVATVARAFPYAKYEVFYSSLQGFEELWRQLAVDFQNRPSEQAVEIIEEDEEVNLEELDEEIRKGHLSEMVENILISAVRVNASDVHIIPKGAKETEFHFRIDGYLTLWQTLENVRVDAVAAVVKEIAKGPDRFERDMAQDGFVQKTIDSKIVRFRVSIIPIVGKELKVKAESMVIRVLRDPEASITIDNIGFAPEPLERFKMAIEKPHGIVILTGPTGSGKSTTLLAALRAVMTPQLNTITVEDPVEYLIEGARQVKLNPKLDFEGALRAILRHDPDIVMVGEIRDKTTADIAVKLANTGHLTFSTLHTNDAPSAIARLYKMGVEPFLLAYSINVIVAQRLIRKLCDKCKVEDKEVLPITLEKLGFPVSEAKSTKFFKPVGCIHCHNGFKGRTAIHEVLYFTKEIRQLIMEAGSSINEEGLRAAAIKQGMKTLRESALEVLKKGITTVEEIASSATQD